MHAEFYARETSALGSIIDGHAFVDGEMRTGTSLLDDVRSALAENQLATLNGSWAAAFEIDDDILLISDRLGSRPIYYCRTKDTWRVSTDYWELVKTVERYTINGRAFSDLLAYGYVMGSATLLEGIFEVPPGTVSTLKPDGTVKHSRYWSFPRRKASSSTVEEHVDRFVSAAHQIADRTATVLRSKALRPHETVSVNLTGGRDSRVVAWMLHSRGIAFRSFTMRSGTDATIASHVAASLGIAHTVVPPWYENRGKPPSSIVSALSPTTSFNVADGTISVAEYSTVPRTFVTGHVGGAPAGTLHDFRTPALARSGPARLTTLYLSKHTRLAEARLTPLFHDSFRQYAQLSVENLTAAASSMFTTLPALDAERQLNFDNRQRRFIFRDYLAQRQVGRAFMPLLDNEWLDLWRGVPDRWFVGAPLYGRAVRELFGREHQELARIPINGHAQADLASPLRATIIDLGAKLARRVKAPKGTSTYDPVALPERQLPMLDRGALADSWRRLPRDTQYAVVTVSAFIERVANVAGTEPSPPADAPQRGVR